MHLIQLSSILYHSINYVYGMFNCDLPCLPARRPASHSLIPFPQQDEVRK